MLFGEQLWARMEPVYLQILAHPFIGGLTDGSLPPAVFEHYVIQDSHYLRDYAKALASCAALAPDAATTGMFAGHAQQCIEVERSLHQGFLEQFGLSEEEARGRPVLPTTLAYTSYLLRTAAIGSFTEALAAVLPCYWVYARVGAALLARSSPDPLYARWIDTYGGPEFAATVDRVLDVVDSAGETASTAERARAEEHAATTTRYEWMFWQAAWCRETWPV